MAELRTHDGIPDGRLRDRWVELVGRDPTATVFHTPRYLSTWVRELGGDVRPVLRTVHRDGRLIGVVPEARGGGAPDAGASVSGDDAGASVSGDDAGASIRFLGGTRVTDYRGPISGADDRGEVAAAYMRALADDDGWERLVADGLAADSGWVEQLAKHAERHGLRVEERREEDVCPRIDLSGGHEAYLDRLPAKRRHEQRRKARKLAREIGPTELVAVPTGETAEQLEVFLEMAAGSGADADSEPRAAKNRFFSKEEMRGFFVALAEELAPDGALRLHLLDVAGSPAAAAVSLQWGRQWALYNTSFDDVLSPLAPGMVLIGELLRHAAREGFEVFDLLRGDEPYKYRFGATDRPLERLVVTRS